MRGLDDSQDGLNDSAFDSALNPRRKRGAARKSPGAMPEWPRVGDLVDYSAVIGEPPTLFGLTVRTEPEFVGGTWCVWLTGKSGCVAVAALRPAQEPIK